jgi:hypothetical protein
LWLGWLNRQDLFSAGSFDGEMEACGFARKVQRLRRKNVFTLYRAQPFRRHGNAGLMDLIPAEYSET